MPPNAIAIAPESCLVKKDKKAKNPANIMYKDLNFGFAEKSTSSMKLRLISWKTKTVWLYQGQKLGKE